MFLGRLLKIARVRKDPEQLPSPAQLEMNDGPLEPVVTAQQAHHVVEQQAGEALERRTDSTTEQKADNIIDDPAVGAGGPPNDDASEQSVDSADAEVVPQDVKRPPVILVRDDTSEQPIAILGYDYTTPEVIRTAIAFGFQPVVLHAPNGTVSAGATIKVTRSEVEALGVAPTPSFLDDVVTIDVVDEVTFGRVVAERKIPVVVGAYGLRERDFFRENLLFARNSLKYEGRVLHPRFLADYYRNPERRWAIIGFPGSGNMIFQNVCSRLVPPPSVPVWAKDPLSAAVSQFALSYWYSLGNVIANAFDDAGRWQDIAGPSHTRFGATYIGMREQISPIVVAGLPQRSYVWSNPWHTSHEPLTASAIEFFSSQNFKVLQILRHPLDLLVSNAAKITSAAGDRAPQILLQNDDWMESMLQCIEAYYRFIAENRDAAGVHFFRYEELLAAPVSTIRKLAEMLEIECDDAKAEDIWVSLEGKPLSSPGHLWDPRAGKWREFISPRFAQRIINSPLRAYAETMGYELPAEAFEGSRSAVPAHNCQPLDIAWQDARWASSTGKRHAIMHPDLYRMHDKEAGLLMICGRRFEEPMESMRGSPVFSDILAAGGLLPSSEPSLIEEILKTR